MSHQPIPMKKRRADMRRTINLTFQDMSQDRISLEELESRFAWQHFWDTVFATILAGADEEEASRIRLQDVGRWRHQMLKHMRNASYAQKREALYVLGIKVAVYREHQDPRWTINADVRLTDARAVVTNLTWYVLGTGPALRTHLNRPRRPSRCAFGHTRRPCCLANTTCPVNVDGPALFLFAARKAVQW